MIQAWDINWFMLILWGLILFISLRFKNKILLTMDSIIGIIFGITFMTIKAIIGLALIFVNLYFLYVSIEES